MRAIVVTDQVAGAAGMTLTERPDPSAAINDVVVEIHASGFVPTELDWPSTWTDRSGRDRRCPATWTGDPGVSAGLAPRTRIDIMSIIGERIDG
jgi:hypothetical protein